MNNLPKFHPRFIVTHYRCDNCNGGAICQCTDPWPVSVESLDITLAIATGALKDGNVYYFDDASVTHDPNGWWDEVLLYNDDTV